MAIDSQAKRMAVVGVGRPWMRSTFPGTIDEAWRLSVGNAYNGNVLTPLGDNVIGGLVSTGGLIAA